MTLKHLLLILRARWRVLAASVVLVMIATACVNLALPRQYRAVATVVVDVKGNDPVAGGNAQQTQVVPGYLATQIGIVASDRVVKRVIAKLDLEHDPQFRKHWQQLDTADNGAFDTWLTALLLKRLDVRPAHEGNLIDISVS